jgi:hypothetical protein
MRAAKHDHGDQAVPSDLALRVNQEPPDRPAPFPLATIRARADLDTAEKPPPRGLAPRAMIAPMLSCTFSLLQQCEARE